LGDVIAPVGFNTPFPHLLGGGTILNSPASKACFHARPPDSLPPLLGLRPPTKGSYPLGTPNRVPPNAVTLVGGSVTPPDHFKLSPNALTFDNGVGHANIINELFDSGYFKV